MNNKDIVVFGATYHAEAFIALHRAKIKYIIDDKNIDTFHGIKVIGFKEFVTKKYALDYIFIASMTKAKYKMQTMCEELGYKTKLMTSTQQTLYTVYNERFKPKSYLTLLVILVLSLLKIVFPIRLISVKSDRIGHIIGDIDMYLSHKLNDKKRTFDILILNKDICNHEILNLWKRVPQLRFSYYFTFNRLLSVLPIAKDIIQLPVFDLHNISRLYTSSFVSFTKEEEQRGEQLLKKMGLDSKSEYIVFHNRDSAYLKRAYPERDLSYHDYRDVKVHDFELFWKHYTHQKKFVVRLGSDVEETLEEDGFLIGNYPEKYRTDFLDIYIVSKAKFFVGSCSGIFNIAFLFRKPKAINNWAPICKKIIKTAVTPGDLFIPKKYYSTKEERFLTLSEILEFQERVPNLELNITTYLEKEQIVLVDNTPQEILDLALELEDRLENRWVEETEDKQKQAEFWKIFDPSMLEDNVQLKIGAKFLRENPQFLE